MTDPVVREQVWMQILAGVERFQQPIPHKTQGGDCFACATYAAMRHFYPETRDFDLIWSCFAKDGQNVIGATWDTFGSSLERLPLEHYLHWTQPFTGFNYREWEPAWFRHDLPYERFWLDLHAYLSAGWLALAFVNQQGKGPWTPDGFMNSTNHVILLDGARRVTTTHRDETGFEYQRTREEVHVVDSAASDQTGWHEVRNWLWKHGASALHMIRPDAKPK